jgi:hypothetical protein
MVDVKLPDGSIARFPEGMADADIEKVLQNQFKKPSTLESLGKANLDMWKGAGDIVVDAGKGAIEGVVGRGLGILQTGAAGLESLGVESEGLDQFQESGKNVARKLKNFGKGTGIAGAIGQIGADPLTLASMGISLPLKAGGIASIPIRATQRVGYGAAGGAVEGATAPVTNDGQRAENVALGAAFGGGIGAASSLPIVGAARLLRNKVYRPVKEAITPATRDTLESRASDRLRELTPENGDLVNSLQQKTITNLTPARATGDVGLESLEAVAMKNPEANRALQQRQQEALQVIKKKYDALQKQGAPEEALAAVRQRAQGVIDKLAGRTKSTEQSMNSALDIVNPSYSPAHISESVRSKIANSRAQAVSEGSALYDAVPNIRINPSVTSKVFGNLLKETPVAQLDEIPKDLMQSVLELGKPRNVATGLLDAAGNPITKQMQSGRQIDVKEMQGLRSKLIEQSAKARAIGDKGQAYTLDKLADAVMTDLDQLANETGNSALRTANKFWREQVKERFDQGAIGDVMRADRDRGVAVAQEMTLESLLGAGRAKGNVGIDRLLKASPDALPEAQQYMLARFRDTAIKESGLNIGQANKFLRDNQDIFSRTEFSGVKKAINDAMEAQGKYVKAHDRQKAVVDALTGATEKTLVGKQRISATSKFLNADTDKALDGFIANGDINGLRNLKRTVAKDATGAAQVGLRSAMIKKIIGDGTDGNAVMQALNNPRIFQAAKELIPGDQLNRITQLATEQMAWQRQLKDSVAGGKLSTPNNLLQLMFQLYSARTAGTVKNVIGIKDTGGSFAISGFFGKTSKRIADRLSTRQVDDLLMEAAQDKKLMANLLAKPKSAKEARLLEQRMNIWLNTNAGRSFRNDSDGEEQGQFETPNNGMKRQPLELNIPYRGQ